MHQRSVRQRLISGGAWAGGVGLLGVPLSLAEGSLLARVLTPGDFASYVVLFSVVTAGTTLVRFGLGNAVVRLVSEGLAQGNPGRAASAVRKSAVYALLSASTVAAALLAGLGDLLADAVVGDPAAAGAVGLAALWIAVLAFRGLLAEVFRGLHRIALASILQKPLSDLIAIGGLLAFLLLAGGATLFQAVALVVISSACAVGVGVGALLRARDHLRGPGTVGHSELLRIALPLLANSLVAILLHQSTIWLLALFSTRDDVALFGAAARLAAATTVPLALANAVLPPLIAELNVLGKRADLEQMLRTVATFSVVLVAPLLLAFVFFGEQILSAVFGSYYASAWPALLLLAAGQFFNVATGSCGFTLTMTGHQTGYLVITILGGSATLALGLLLIPRFGSSGAAASAAMGLLLQYSAMVWLAHKRLGIWTHAGLPRPALLRRLISDLRKQVRGA